MVVPSESSGSDTHKGVSMSSVVRLPRWIVRKAWEPNGERLEKRIHILPEPEIVCATSQKTVGFGTVKTRVSNTVDGKIPPYHVNNEHTIVLSDKKLLFDNWEYRFWAVELIAYQPISAECRNCNKLFFTSEARRKHPSDHDCFRTLIGAYELLLRDKRCVICDKVTSSKAWGVPLCLGSSCMNTWMHLDAQPNALLQALSLQSQQKGPLVQ